MMNFIYKKSKIIMDTKSSMANDGKLNVPPPPKQNPSDATRGQVNVPPPPTTHKPSSGKIEKK